MSPSVRPLRVAIVNDYELVVAGVAAMLAPHHERIAVVELDSGLPVVSDVDVILYDTFGQVQGDGVDLEDLVRGPGRAGRHLQLEHPARPGGAGDPERAPPATSPRSSRRRRSSARSRRCTTARSWSRRRGRRPAHEAKGDWPGPDAGLTAREAEVLALITQGLSNQEIAERSYLSINSVKTYIRTAYRKIGVTRRAQAVVWGMHHGFEPTPLRVIETSRPE